MFYAITYLYIFKIKLQKPASIPTSLISAMAVWFILALPFAFLKFDNLLISIILYIISASIAYYFLTIRPKVKSTASPIKYTHKEIIIRAIFAGTVVAIAVFLSKILNTF